MNAINKDVKLNLGAYEIGTGLIGAPIFLVYMGFSAALDVVGGEGTISQSTVPPLDLKTQLYGVYTVQKSGEFKVQAVGYPIFKQLKLGVIKKGISPNVQLEMTLAPNLLTGVATYSYLNSANEWVTIKDVPVNKKEIIPSPIDLLLVADTSAILAAQCTTSNMYVVSTQGLNVQISCTNGQPMIWNIAPIAPSGNVKIVSFSGEMVDDKICVPRKKGNYWEGVIQEHSKKGTIDYSVNLLVENVPYTYDMSFILK